MACRQLRGCRKDQNACYEVIIGEILGHIPDELRSNGRRGGHRIGADFPIH